MFIAQAAAAPDLLVLVSLPSVNMQSSGVGDASELLQFLGKDGEVIRVFRCWRHGSSARLIRAIGATSENRSWDSLLNSSDDATTNWTRDGTDNTNSVNRSKNSSSEINT